MKYDLSGEIDFSCMDLDDISTNDIVDSITRWDGAFIHTEEIYLNETGYRHIQIAPFDH